MNPNRNGLLRHIARSKAAKAVSVFLALEIVVQSVNPAFVMALTSGPAQPETQQFKPIEMTQMVDPFTGDFSYNIPLMEVGDYPLNLNYQSGITQDDEASWAGLGWNVHTGAITRQMRGLPDDFRDDPLTRTLHMKDNLTIGVKVEVDWEIFGFDAMQAINNSGINVNVGTDVRYNSYRGFGLTNSTGAGFGRSGEGSHFPLTAGLNVSAGPDGLDINPSISFQGLLNVNGKGTNGEGQLGFGFNLNSRAGLTGMSFSYNLQPGSLQMGYNSSSFISFGQPTFTPAFSFPMTTSAGSGKIKIGGDAIGQDIGVTIKGYGARQKLSEETSSNPSYGYIYAEKAGKNVNAVHDFNREKDGSFSKETNNLPLTNFTYDIFSISAQGLSGTFRPYRDDAGYVYDTETLCPSTSLDFGGEVNTGNIVAIGLDFTGNFIDSKSGPWLDGNGAAPRLPFRAKKPDNIRESFHFKMMGETNVNSDPTFHNALKGEEAVRFALGNASNNFEVGGLPRFVNKYDQALEFNTPQRSNRQNRNTAIYHLTKGELLQAYPWKAKYVSKHAKDHHIAEITVIQPDGTRYVFGLAAYNTVKREISFSAGTGGTDVSLVDANSAATGVVSYVSQSDIAPGKKRGLDHYYDETSTPAYAHSWMLTEILSADYTDVTGDGPTPDDLGTYTKFNYGKTDQAGKTIPDIENFKWRTPVTGSSQAAYLENLKTDTRDDKANIVYGEKDVWYVHSIESKTQIAVFETSDRTDALGVNLNGSTDLSKAPQQLDRIKLYSKAEYDAGPGSAVPLKTAHFVYKTTDKLCPGNPNSTDGRGKLTLEKVFFTYQNSNEGRFSPYEFEYLENPTGDGSLFTYKFGKVDRWGVLKPDEQLPAGSGLTHTEYPYAIQDKALRDEYSSAWHLNKIKLPSGGTINVEYESDDYAFVQEKSAMRMFRIVGLAKEANGEIKPNIYSSAGTTGMRDYLVVDLGEPMNTPEFRLRYLEGYGPASQWKSRANSPLNKLYFRFMMNVNNGIQAINNPDYEYISGYVDIDEKTNCGIRSDNPNYAYIKIKRVQAKFGAINQNVSPFAFSAWQFSRLFTPKKAYNQAEYDDPVIMQFLKTITTAEISHQLIEFFKGPNGRMLQEGFGNRVDPARSWVRLMEPHKRKLGGNNRVKKIVISDGWESMSPTEKSASYGQEYTYTEEDGASTGVAAYEPGTGADENALRMPSYYNGPKQLLIAQEKFYLEEPFGESFFPAPTVGYSKVTVRDITFDPRVTQNRTGKTVYEFYTAFDFPIRTDQTKIKAEPRKSNILGQLFKVNFRNYMTVSQGYSITVNDMHGKPKKVSLYGEGQPEPFAYTRYNYKQKPDHTLDNEVQVVERDGSVSKKRVGTEIDFVADMREQTTRSKTVNVQANIAGAFVGPVPISVFTLFGGFSQERTRFRSAVATKVISQYGIRESVETYDKGIHITTAVEAFDARTGEPIVKRIGNEFKDQQYALDYPAHWVYSGMRQAAENIGYMFSTDHIHPSDFAITDANLEPGDEVLRLGKYPYGRGEKPNTGNANTLRLWVARDQTNQKLYLINNLGQKYVPDVPEYFQVIRSGHRNMQSLPIANAASLVSPVVDNNGTAVLKLDANARVISSTALEYAEQWRTTVEFAKSKIDTVCTVPTQVAALIDILNGVNGSFGSPFTHDYGTPPAGTVNLGSTYTNRFAALLGNTACMDFTKYTSVVAEPGPYSHLLHPACADGSFASPGQFWGYFGAPPGTGPDSCRCFYTACVPSVPQGYTLSGPGSVWSHIDTFTGNFFFNTNYVYPSSPNNAVALEVKMDNGSLTHLLFVIECLQPANTTCEYVSTYACSYNVNDIINPYIYGVLGNWRPKTDYYFIGNRNNTDPGSAENLRTDGYLPGFKPFWATSSSVWGRNTAVNLQAYENWTAKNEMTVYTPYGFDVENKNLLPAFNASTYGYRNTLPLSLVSNAMYKEIGFDGFEDYYPNVPLPDPNCLKAHFKFEDFRSQVSAEQSHTGLYAVKIPATSALNKKVKVSGPYQNPNPHSIPFVLQEHDLLTGFSPNSGQPVKRYVLSFWAKHENRGVNAFSYSGITPMVKLGSTSVTVAGSLKQSKIINDWQRFEILFEIPLNTTAGTELEISIGNKNFGAIFIDDIRVHPFDANMKSYVYNAVNNRYMAQLDENNFATFYEYDEEGGLIRVKKETERGIVTVQESKTQLYKR